MKPKPDKHPKQDLPDEIIGKMMGLIRGQFCGDMTPKEWAQHHGWIKKNVVLWPAHYVCNVRKFTLPPERYLAIMREIFDGIKAHGNTAAVKYWPGYLMKCVQDHWKIHWEDYYGEAKAVRNIALHAVATLGKAPAEDKTLETMALAQKALLPGRKTVGNQTKKPANNRQLTMFDF